MSCMAVPARAKARDQQEHEVRRSVSANEHEDDLVCPLATSCLEQRQQRKKDKAEDNQQDRPCDTTKHYRGTRTHGFAPVVVRCRHRSCRRSLVFSMGGRYMRDVRPDFQPRLVGCLLLRPGRCPLYAVLTHLYPRITSHGCSRSEHIPKFTALARIAPEGACSTPEAFSLWYRPCTDADSMRLEPPNDASAHRCCPALPENL
jgi:hypothetical protein